MFSSSSSGGTSILPTGFQDESACSQICPDLTYTQSKVYFIGLWSISNDANRVVMVLYVMLLCGRNYWILCLLRDWIRPFVNWNFGAFWWNKFH